MLREMEDEDTLFDKQTLLNNDPVEPEIEFAKGEKSDWCSRFIKTIVLSTAFFALVSFCNCFNSVIQSSINSSLIHSFSQSFTHTFDGWLCTHNYGWGYAFIRCLNHRIEPSW